MTINFNPNSQKYISAKNVLPKNLHSIYAQLVDEYIFYTNKHYGHGYVAYQVLADLVKDGWKAHGGAKE